MFPQELLDAIFAAKCVTSSIYIVACFLDGGSESFVVAPDIYSARFRIHRGSESANVFFLDCAPWARTPTHVTDCCN
jgi:hypothetical protein